LLKFTLVKRLEVGSFDTTGLCSRIGELHATLQVVRNKNGPCSLKLFSGVLEKRLIVLLSTKDLKVTNITPADSVYSRCCISRLVLVIVRAETVFAHHLFLVAKRICSSTNQTKLEVCRASLFTSSLHLTSSRRCILGTSNMLCCVSIDAC
jgi:hypothetical protein